MRAQDFASREFLRVGAAYGAMQKRVAGVNQKFKDDSARTTAQYNRTIGRIDQGARQAARGHADALRGMSDSLAKSKNAHANWSAGVRDSLRSQNAPIKANVAQWTTANARISEQLIKGHRTLTGSQKQLLREQQAANRVQIAQAKEQMLANQRATDQALAEGAKRHRAEQQRLQQGIGTRKAAAEADKRMWSDRRQAAKIWHNEQQALHKADRDRQMQAIQQRQQLAAQMQATGMAMAMIGSAMTIVGVAGVSALASMTLGAAEARVAFGRAATQAQDLNATTDDMVNIALRVAKDIPLPFEEMADGLYDIFSTIDVSMEDGEKALREFSRAAIAGGTDLETAGRAIMAVMNAWKLEISDVTEINDIMFTMVERGAGTYEEFASHIGKAIPAAAQAGQDFKTLGASLSFMTRINPNVAQGTTAVARSMELIADSRVVERMEKLGITVKDSSGEFLPLRQILKQLHERFKNLTRPELNQALRELFGGAGYRIQARRFLVPAILNFERLDLEFKKMSQREGATRRAYAIMFKEPQVQIDLLKNRMTVLGQTIGQSFFGVLGVLSGIAGQVLSIFESIPDSLRNFTLGLAGALAAVLAITGPIVALLGFIKLINGMLMASYASMKVFTFGLWAAEATVGRMMLVMAAWQIAIVALAAAVGLLIVHWDRFKVPVLVAAGVLTAVFLPAISTAISSALGLAGTWAGVTGLMVADSWKAATGVTSAWAFMARVIPILAIITALTLLITHFDKVKAAASAMADFLSDLWDRIVNAWRTGDLAQRIGMVTAAVALLAGAIKVVFFTGFVAGIKDAIKWIGALNIGFRGLTIGALASRVAMVAFHPATVALAIGLGLVTDNSKDMTYAQDRLAEAVFNAEGKVRSASGAMGDMRLAMMDIEDANSSGFWDKIRRGIDAAGEGIGKLPGLMRGFRESFGQLDDTFGAAADKAHALRQVLDSAIRDGLGPSAVTSILNSAKALDDFKVAADGSLVAIDKNGNRVVVYTKRELEALRKKSKEVEEVTKARTEADKRQEEASRAAAEADQQREQKITEMIDNIKKFPGPLQAWDNAVQIAQSRYSDLVGKAQQAAEEGPAAMQELADKSGTSLAELEEMVLHAQTGIDRFGAVQKDAADGGIESWRRFNEMVGLSLFEFNEQLQQQLTAQQEWTDNLLTIADKYGEDAALIALEWGRERADIVQMWADGEVEQGQRTADLLIEQQNFTNDELEQLIRDHVAGILDEENRGARDRADAARQGGADRAAAEAEGYGTSQGALRAHGEDMKRIYNEDWKDIATQGRERQEEIRGDTKTWMDRVKEIIKWDTIKTKFGEFWEGFKETFSTSWNDLVSDFSGIWDDIKGAASGAWNGITEGAKGVIEWFGNNWRDIEIPIFGSIGTIVDGLTGMWDGIYAAFRSAVTTIGNILWTMLTPVRIVVELVIGAFQSIPGIWNKIIGPALSSAWNTTWDTAKGIFQGAWNGIKAIARAIWTELVQWWNTEWDKWKGRWDGFWSDVKGIFNGVWTAIRETAKAIWNEITDWFSDRWNDYKTEWGKHWTKIHDTFREKWNTIKSTGQSIWNALTDWWSERWNTFKATWRNRWETAVSIFRTAFSPIVGAFQTIWGKVSSAWSTGWRNIGNFIAPIFRTVSGILDALGIAPLARSFERWASGADRWGESNRPDHLARGGEVPMSEVGSGFKTNGIRAIVGEGRRAYPEYVIPTDPQYRSRALSLWNSAARDLGAPAFAEGGILDRIKRVGSDGLRAIGRTGKAAFDALWTDNDLVQKIFGGPADMAGDAFNKMLEMAGKVSSGLIEKAWPKRGMKGEVPHDMLSAPINKMRERVIDLARIRANDVENTLMGGGGNIVQIGRMIQGMGYRVSEHPAFGGVHPVHVPNSYHYRGQAIDVNWPGSNEPQKLDQLHSWIKRNVQGIAELIWRAPGHWSHLHLAVQPGGFMGGHAGIGGAGRWRGTALQALSMAGMPAGWVTSLLARMNKESGGNPRAINLWDSNARRGTPSKGLMQLIDPTFNAYAGPLRSRGIWDPLANIYASIRYANARYGSAPIGWNRSGGYKEGGILQAFAQGGMVGNVQDDRPDTDAIDFGMVPAFHKGTNKLHNAKAFRKKYPYHQWNQHLSLKTRNERLERLKKALKKSKLPTGGTTWTKAYNRLRRGVSVGQIVADLENARSKRQEDQLERLRTITAGGEWPPKREIASNPVPSVWNENQWKKMGARKRGDFLKKWNSWTDTHRNNWEIRQLQRKRTRWAKERQEKIKELKIWKEARSYWPIAPSPGNPDAYRSWMNGRNKLDFKIKELKDRIDWLKPRVKGIKTSTEKTKAAKDKAKQAKERIYVVKRGDNLWNIAKRVYGAGHKWRTIYRKNRDLIGNNPDLIRPGQRLKYAKGGVVPTFDTGGTLMPGLNLVNNKTGAPERVENVDREKRLEKKLDEVIQAIHEEGGRFIINGDGKDARDIARELSIRTRNRIK